MMNTRKMWGVLHLRYFTNTERRQGSVTLFPIRLPKGGQRWLNTSDKGGVING